jgi:hypothetical protein
MDPDQFRAYKRFADSVERWLIAVIRLLIVGLVLFQAMLAHPALRVRLTVVDRLEGKPIAAPLQIRDPQW